MDPRCVKYIEPFVGSGQLFFAAKPSASVLGDTNTNLINCYQCVQQAPEKVFELLKKFPVGKEEYYKIRGADDSLWEPERRAAKFIYLNTFCFNGLYRTNKSGVFNVPFSASSAKMLSYEEIMSVSLSLVNSKLCAGDFESIVKENCQKDDFVYLDPPYAVRNKDIFLQYGPETFGLSDLERLRNLLKFIDGMDATFLLSYACCDESLDLAKSWKHKIITTVRNISGFAKHRKTENEILISNKDFND